MWDVAVIGAGLSGITCARQLAAAGQRVCILDKSRGLGGRMATRRVALEANQERRVDHGLRYWQPQTEGLQALTHELIAAGILKPWAVKAYEIRQREVLTPIETASEATGETASETAAPMYVAEAGMSAIAKYLTLGFTLGENLFTEHRATKISYSQDHWRIDCDGTESIVAKRCAIAIPAPQAADLLNTYPADDSRSTAIAAALQSMGTVAYQPCLTVLAGYPPKYLNQMGELDASGWMVTDHIGTSTDWVGLDSSKRGSHHGPVMVIHSKPAFAEQYIDAGDLQPAASVLLRVSARKLQDWMAQPNWFQVHRWRYAQATLAHPESALKISDSLVCGGDWCVEKSRHEPLPSIDHAYLSGLAMAQAIE